MRRILSAVVLALPIFGIAPAFLTTPAISSSIQREGDPKVIVWVNTDSGIYHCPGTRWYGRIKEGKYPTQKQAQTAGYRPAYGSVCG